MSRPTLKAGLLAISLTAAWVSAGIAPLRDAWAGALAPSDFATDFVPASRLWRGLPARVDLALGNAEAVRLGAPGYADVGVPFGAHPPVAVMLVASLVPLGFRGAALFWLALSLLALALVAWVSADAAGVSEGRRSAGAVAIFAALTVWPPVLHNIEKGQWSLMLAGLLAGGWWAATRGYARLAGGLIATAGMVKVMPLLLVAALVLPAAARRRQFLIGATAAALILGAVSLVTVGPQAWTDFVFAAPTNTRGWQTAPANTLSLWGASARLLIGGPFARPLSTVAAMPLIAWMAWLLQAGALLAVARSVGARDARLGFASWSVLAVALGPLSWSHAATWLVLPMALLAGQAKIRVPTGEIQEMDLLSDPRVWLGAAAVLLSIPRATLLALAGPLPVSPGRGLLLGIHLVGALVLFALTVAARPRFRPPRDSEAQLGAIA